jgi:hypothetical protein
MQFPKGNKTPQPSQCWDQDAEIGAPASGDDIQRPLAKITVRHGFGNVISSPRNHKATKAKQYMDNPAFNQKVKVMAVGAAGLLFAVYLGNQIGSENYGELILGAVIVIAACIGLFSGRFFWVMTIASSSLAGTFPLLGGSFTPFQILMAMGVAKFLIEDVVLKRTKINTGTQFDTLLIAGFMGVLTWHGIHDRFGMKFLGSSVWGGRNYINVYVGLAAFFVIQSIPMSPKLWAKLPYIILGVSGFDLMITVITTIFPNSIYKIYPFYSAVSRTGIEEIVTGGPIDTTRLGSVGNFGTLLITLILAKISLRQILHLSNFPRLIIAIFGFLAVLFSSFRSAVFNTLTVIFVAGIRDLKWAVLALLPFLAIILFGLSVVNSEFVTLPKQFQRSLSFVPGKWDVDTALDATSSNDFRTRIWTIWTREYFPKHPIFGRGFGFESSWGERSVYRNDPNEDVQMVETGNIHNGFFSTVDCFGIIGTIFFVIWNFRLLVQAFGVSFQKDDPSGIALRFLALSLAASIIFYWISASSVGTFLPSEFALAAVFLRLKQSSAGAPARSIPEQGSGHLLSKRLVPI